MSGNLAALVKTTVVPLGPDATNLETWRVTVEFPDDLPWGWQSGNLTINGTYVDETGASNPVKMNMAVNGNVAGELEPSTNMIRLGALTPGDPIDRNISISRRDGQPFEVLGDPVIEGGGLGIIRATVSPLDPARTVWQIQTKGAAPARVGTLAGNVILRTDVPGEELIAVRYAGVVQQRRANRP